MSTGREKGKSYKKDSGKNQIFPTCKDNKLCEIIQPAFPTPDNKNTKSRNSMPKKRKKTVENLESKQKKHTFVAQTDCVCHPYF
ncbi:MAG: hypothetical protein NC204_06600 [Candidatus Amulumruptor caecigallinarius]|nr:hypothetical protein [Candidatus Amulumruptor caecigallinarius]